MILMLLTFLTALLLEGIGSYMSVVGWNSLLVGDWVVIALFVALDLAKIKSKRSDYILFNETAGCFVVEVESEKIAGEVFKNVPFTIIGKTQKQATLNVRNNKKTLFNTSLEKLKAVWQKPMEEMFP